MERFASDVFATRYRAHSTDAPAGPSAKVVTVKRVSLASHVTDGIGSLPSSSDGVVRASAQVTYRPSTDSDGSSEKADLSTSSMPCSFSNASRSSPFTPTIVQYDCTPSRYFGNSPCGASCATAAKKSLRV